MRAHRHGLAAVRSGWWIGPAIVLAGASASAAAPKQKPIGSMTIYSGETSDVYAVGFTESQDGDRVAFSGIEVTKPIDGVTPKIFFDVARGNPLPVVTIRLILADKGSATYVLDSVLLVGASQALASDKPIALETITLKPARMQVTTTDSSGNSETACWDLTQNVSC